MESGWGAELNRSLIIRFSLRKRTEKLISHLNSNIIFFTGWHQRTCSFCCFMLSSWDFSARVRFGLNIKQMKNVINIGGQICFISTISTLEKTRWVRASFVFGCARIFAWSVSNYLQANGKIIFSLPTEQTMCIINFKEVFVVWLRL